MNLFMGTFLDYTFIVNIFKVKCAHFLHFGSNLATDFAEDFGNNSDSAIFLLKSLR